MKKTYIQPSTEVLFVAQTEMIAASGVSGTGAASDISYGGIDTDGSKDPSVKEENFWE